MAPVQVDLHPNQSAASHCREKRLLSLQQAAYLLRLPDIVIIASFRALRCGNCCLTWAIDLLLLLPQFVLLLPCYHVCSTDVSAALHRHHPRSGSAVALMWHVSGSNFGKAQRAEASGRWAGSGQCSWQAVRNVMATVRAPSQWHCSAAAAPGAGLPPRVHDGQHLGIRSRVRLSQHHH